MATSIRPAPSTCAKRPSAAEPVDNAFIARECPRLAKAARWFQPGEWNTTFELGVQAMLQALERDAQP